MGFATASTRPRSISSLHPDRVVSDADAFAWIDEDELFDAYCLTAVVGLSIDEVVSRFGGDVSSASPSTFSGAFSGFPDPAYLLADALEGGVLAAENNGWQGVDEAVAARVSRGALVAALYSSVNADMRFVFAENGVVKTVFDPLLPEVDWEGSDPHALDAVVDGLLFGEASPGAAGLALAERLTGLRVSRTWFDETHSRFDMPSPY